MSRDRRKTKRDEMGEEGGGLREKKLVVGIVFHMYSVVFRFSGHREGG